MAAENVNRQLNGSGSFALSCTTNSTVAVAAVQQINKTQSTMRLKKMKKKNLNRQQQINKQKKNSKIK